MTVNQNTPGTQDCPQQQQKTQDICVHAFPGTDWTDAGRKDALKSMTDFAVCEAESAADWYLEKKRSKQFWARSLRLAAILFTGASGLMPLLAEIFSEPGQETFSPAWASVMLVFAGLCIGLDRFFGFSTAWVRYITSAMVINEKINDFRFALEMQRLKASEGGIDADEAAEILEKAQLFMADVQAVVRQETDSWAKEFSSVISELDKNAKALGPRGAGKPGGPNANANAGANANLKGAA